MSLLAPHVSALAWLAASTSSNGAPFGSQDEAAAPATKPGRLDECASCMAASEQQLLLYAVMPPRDAFFHSRARQGSSRAMSASRHDCCMLMLWPVKCHRAPRPNFRASGGGPPVLVRAAAAPMTSDYVIDSDDEAELRSASTPIGLEQHLGAAHLFGPLRPLRWAMANSARATAHGARTLTALSSRIGRRRTRRRRLIRRSRLLAVDGLKSPRKLKGGRVDDCGDGARRSVLHPVVGWTGSNAVAFRARDRALVRPRARRFCVLSPKAVAYIRVSP